MRYTNFQEVNFNVCCVALKINSTVSESWGPELLTGSNSCLTKRDQYHIYIYKHFEIWKKFPHLFTLVTK